MARDRKRAKQRRDRRSGRASARGTAGAVPTPNVPGELEHASADVDEFEAALARGAGGVAPPAPDAADSSPAALDEEPVAEGLNEVEGLEEDGRGGGVSGPPGDGGGGGEAARERPSGAPLPSGNRAMAFIRASWAELQRVQWPDRRQVTQATAVVLGFVAVAGAYLGGADFVAKEIVEFVL